MSLEDYHQQVRDAIARRNGRPILNSNIEHATIIIQEAFNYAKKSIRILSSRLDPACYAQPGVIDAAKVFLADPDHRAQILVESELWDPQDHFEWDKHPLLDALANYRERLELRLVPRDWIASYTYNFLIMDDYGYRFEADRSLPTAVAAFYPEDGKQPQIKNLEEIFETLWKASKPHEWGIPKKAKEAA
jgi:hypothetical protein